MFTKHCKKNIEFYSVEYLRRYPNVTKKNNACYNYFLHLSLERSRNTFEWAMSARRNGDTLLSLTVFSVTCTWNTFAPRPTWCRGSGPRPSAATTTVVGRLRLVSPTRSTRPGRAVSVRFLFIYFSRTVHFFTRATTTTTAAADASPQKLIRKPLRDRCQRLWLYHERANTHTHTTTAAAVVNAAIVISVVVVVKVVVMML